MENIWVQSLGKRLKRTIKSFLLALAKDFTVNNKLQQPFQPTEKHQFGMYLDTEFYSLDLKSKMKILKLP
jgi:uncharacterized protein (DUF1015 family)